MDAPDEPHEPDELPRLIAIAILGETALDHLHEVAQHMQESIAQVLAEDSQGN
jgi:hypothetical protein